MRIIYEIYFEFDGVCSWMETQPLDQWGGFVHICLVAHKFWSSAGRLVGLSCRKTKQYKQNIYSTTIQTPNSTYPTHTQSQYVAFYVNGMHGVFISFIIICFFVICRNTNQTVSNFEINTLLTCSVCFNRLYIVVNTNQIIIFVLENCHHHIVILCSHTYTTTYDKHLII